MRSRLLPCAIASMTFVSCAGGTVGPTFQDGVELVPGPAYILVRIEPPDALQTHRIEVIGDDGRLVLFTSHRGSDRFVSGVTLPSTVMVWVDGSRCKGSLDVVSDVEYDATLSVDGESCSLRLELSHPPEAIDHHLEDGTPAAS